MAFFLSYMVALDATLKSSSDHDAPALTSADVPTPGCVAMNGTLAVQMSVAEMGCDVVAGYACCWLYGSKNPNNRASGPKYH